MSGTAAVEVSDTVFVLLKIDHDWAPSIHFPDMPKTQLAGEFLLEHAYVHPDVPDTHKNGVLHREDGTPLPLVWRLWKCRYNPADDDEDVVFILKPRQMAHVPAVSGVPGSGLSVALTKAVNDLQLIAKRLGRTPRKVDAKSFSKASATALEKAIKALKLKRECREPPITTVPKYPFRPYNWPEDVHHLKPKKKEMADLIELGQRLLLEAELAGDLIDVQKGPLLQVHLTRKDKLDGEEILVKHIHRGLLNAILVDGVPVHDSAGEHDAENYDRALGVIEYKTPKAFTSTRISQNTQAQFKLLGLFVRIERDGVPLLATDFKTQALLYCIEGSVMVEYRMLTRNPSSKEYQWTPLDPQTAWRVWLHLTVQAREKYKAFLLRERKRLPATIPYEEEEAAAEEDEEVLDDDNSVTSGYEHEDYRCNAPAAFAGCGDKAC